MDPLLGVLLFIHIGAAIIAFGPGFVFPIIGAMGGREPAHANFAIRITYAISTRSTLPAAIVVGLAGVAMIWVARLDLFGQRWLLSAIVLYLIALGLAAFVAIPNGRRLIEATSSPPPAPSPGAPASSGPPPHIAAMVRRSQLAGMALSGLVLLILLLMIFKPTF
jgi:hypothetical protein